VGFRKIGVAMPPLALILEDGLTAAWARGFEISGSTESLGPSFLVLPAELR
jgi:hypothetical protein